MRMPLRSARGVLSALFLAGGLVATARAEEGIAVISGPDKPAIVFNRANLQDIFSKRIQVDDAGHALAPLNLPPADPLREALSLALFGQRPAAMQRYWTEQYFHGIAPPYVVSSQEAMLRFVAETPGAIGYVAHCQVDKRVQVLARLPVPAELATRVRHLCD